MENTSQYIRYQVHKRSVGVAIVFCLLFGMLGLHRFYLGKESSGAAMLILSITLIGLPVAWVWSIIDLFMIGSMVHKHNTRLADKLEEFYDDPPRYSRRQRYRNY